LEELEMDKKEPEKISEGRPKGSNSQPLKGRTVMVTRPLAQSEEITSLLEHLGASVIHCPTIEVVEPADRASIDSAIDRLESYDWIIFTSSNGVEFFFRRLIERRKGAIDLPPRLITFAIGPATARALKAACGRADLVAAESKAEGALRAIIDHLGGQERLRGLRFLIPRAQIAREVLPVELGRLGAVVDAIETYRTVRPNLDSDALVQLFRERRIDAVTFTSPSTVSNFAHLVGMKNLSALFESVAVACIGPVTAQAAAEHGIRGVIQPQDYNAVALVAALADAIGKT
jgi:uroporphyrinogen III methyltransferase/synthase